MQTALFIVAAFLTLAAAAGWLNQRFFRMPASLAMLMAGLVCALLLGLADRFWPENAAFNWIGSAVTEVDFSGALLDFLLAFVLFSGGLGIDSGLFRSKWRSAAALAGLGTVLSVVAIYAGIVLLAAATGMDVPPAWALVFAALVAPTDAVAVQSVDANAISKEARVVLQGEALFNDGVGIVLYGSALAAAMSNAPIHPGEAGLDMLRESVLGLLVGYMGGWLAVRILRNVDDLFTDVLITMATAAAVFAISLAIGASGPIAAALAGVMVGGISTRHALTKDDKRYMRGFWRVIDGLLNAFIFLLLGLEAISIDAWGKVWFIALAAAFIALFARGLAVSLTGLVLRGTPIGSNFRSLPVLVWGGARGAVSVALALAIPESPYRQTILACAFAAVLVSMFIQLPTLSRVADWARR
ncbi:sodium:proton antiporter [Novosphingobium sp. ZN18A2]|uniref:cation:proton antiporter n=1 Tax=Novosphingobium sp. ZN18A2 TaxID=3079861 RepID=UPI0030CEC4E6